VRLPYGGGQWGMIVVLPQPGASLKQAEEAFLGSPASWSDGFTEGATVLHLPKFTFKKRAIMNDLLKNLGMHRAFDPSRADFSGMEEDADKRLYVSRVLHKAFIAVDELGTEAAAVTEADAAGSSGPPPESFEFRADRPFFFAIADRTTGTLAFLGAVADPTSTSGDD
jgi:serine protease inhibitor